MKEGAIVLAAIPQSDGSSKPRPALDLRSMPPFDDLLVCGISSQLRHEAGGFDEIIRNGEGDFNQSGLLSTSLIRLGFLALVPRRIVLMEIGSISTERHQRLLQKLAAYLVAKPRP